MSATLPTNWNPNHAPTAAEAAQVLNAITRITNIATAWSESVSVSTTSASYIDVTGLSTSYTKNGDSSSSDLLVFVLTGWRTNSIANARWGVGIGGTDYDVVEFELTTMFNAHIQTVGWVKITGVAAGSYTVQGRVKRKSGTGTITSDSSDTFALLVIELPK